jgi:hypothetical protein
MTQDILAAVIIILLGISPFIFSSLLNIPRYRIKEINNLFIPQVRKKFTWYGISEFTLSLSYENSLGEGDCCTFKTLDEAVKVLDRYKEAIREKEVKYHEYK